MRKRAGWGCKAATLLSCAVIGSQERSGGWEQAGRQAGRAMANAPGSTALPAAGQGEPAATSHSALPPSPAAALHRPDDEPTPIGAVCSKQAEQVIAKQLRNRVVVSQLRRRAAKRLVKAAERAGMKRPEAAQQGRAGLVGGWRACGGSQQRARVMPVYKHVRVCAAPDGVTKCRCAGWPSPSSHT